MLSRLVILGLAAALLATPLPAAAQHCYLHMQIQHTQKAIGGVGTQCRMVTYITTSSAVSPAGFSNVNVIYNTPGPACASSFAAHALFSDQKGWSCYHQTYNGSVQAARPPGAW